MADGRSGPTHARRILSAALPYLTAVAVLGMVAALIAAIYFTLLDLEWIAFLAGTLFAAIVAMVSQASRAQWLIARRSAQLVRVRELLAQELSRRKHAENALAAAQSELALLRAPPDPVAATGSTAKAAEGQSLYVESITEQLTGWTSAAERLTAALQNNEFCLYGQIIAPVAPGGKPLYEILIRLIEEEQNLMPPGAFLPLAEEHGLMPSLDRWVVRNVLEWQANRRRTDPDHAMIICCVNLASATIADPEFAAYVLEQQQIVNIPVGGLCFEVDENDVAAHTSDRSRQIALLKKMGCRVTLSGFGRNAVSLDILKKVSVDFIKIDGNVILSILRDEVDLAKAAAINRVAHALGIKTIAEFVESDEILAKLREIGVDYAQGFGISRPRPLNEIEFTSH
ncbi:MAG: EAL domain-containing protein [Betaproteobacteria bacterium]|nr:EAL domain-containing protein [Betaproteobacteria bacterium]